MTITVPPETRISLLSLRLRTMSRVLLLFVWFLSLLALPLCGRLIDVGVLPPWIAPDVARQVFQVGAPIAAVLAVFTMGIALAAIENLGGYGRFGNLLVAARLFSRKLDLHLSYHSWPKRGGHTDQERAIDAIMIGIASLKMSVAANQEFADVSFHLSSPIAKPGLLKALGFSIEEKRGKPKIKNWFQIRASIFSWNWFVRPSVWALNRRCPAITKVKRKKVMTHWRVTWVATPESLRMAPGIQRLR